MVVCLPGNVALVFHIVDHLLPNGLRGLFQLGQVADQVGPFRFGAAEQFGQRDLTGAMRLEFAVSPVRSAPLYRPTPGAARRRPAPAR